jgi:hypothetical protein
MDWVGAAGQVFRAEFSRPDPGRLFLERLKLNCSRLVGKGITRPHPDLLPQEKENLLESSA